MDDADDADDDADGARDISAIDDADACGDTVPPADGRRMGRAEVEAAGASLARGCSAMMQMKDR